MHQKLFAIFLVLLAFSCPAAEPEDVLNQYLDILIKRDFTGVSQLMDRRSMEDLKLMMDQAIASQASQGIYSLQLQIYGKRVSMDEVKNTSSSFYLDQLANSILQAADAQRLIVADRNVIGRVDENDSIVHFVTRLTMKQDDRQQSDIVTYTLVKEDESWKLKFPPTIKSMLTVIESRYPVRR